MGRLRAIPIVLYTLVCLVVIEVGVRRVKLPRLCALAGVSFPSDPAVGRGEVMRDWELPSRDRRRLRVARRVSNHWPLGRGPCLRRSLLIGHLLRRHHPVMRIGLDTTAHDAPLAHAWIEIGGRPLEVVDHYAVFDQTVPDVSP